MQNKSKLMKALSAGVITAALCSSAGAQDMRVNLVCGGSGSVLKSQTSVVNKFNWDTDKLETGTEMRTGKTNFSGTAYVEVSGNAARIRLPNALVPLVRNSHDGWFAVSDLFINPDQITGQVRINGLNKPKLSIDRRSGMLSLRNGLGDFSGRCDPFNPDDDRRRF